MWSYDMGKSQLPAIRVLTWESHNSLLQNTLDVDQHGGTGTLRYNVAGHKSNSTGVVATRQFPVDSVEACCIRNAD